VADLRARFPRFILIGGYDKLVMKRGEAAMRAEFERLLPAMRSGGFIPSVDHQTPPDVPLENYRIYVRLLREYCAKAARAPLQSLIAVSVLPPPRSR
jgi:uroporphyrinogen-III decarboxylase